MNAKLSSVHYERDQPYRYEYLWDDSSVLDELPEDTHYHGVPCLLVRCSQRNTVVLTLVTVEPSGGSHRRQSVCGADNDLRYPRLSPLILRGESTPVFPTPLRVVLCCVVLCVLIRSHGLAACPVELGFRGGEESQEQEKDQGD